MLAEKKRKTICQQFRHDLESVRARFRFDIFFVERSGRAVVSATAEPRCIYVPVILCVYVFSTADAAGTRWHQVPFDLRSTAFCLLKQKTIAISRVHLNRIRISIYVYFLFLVMVEFLRKKGTTRPVFLFLSTLFGTLII